MQLIPDDRGYASGTPFQRPSRPTSSAFIASVGSELGSISDLSEADGGACDELEILTFGRDAHVNASSHPSVLLLGLNYTPEHTGIAPYTTALARHLAAEGFGTTAIVGHPHYPGWVLHPGFAHKQEERIDGGVRLLRVQHPVPASGGGLRRILMEAVFALQVGRRLLRTRADVVIAISPALLTVVPALVSGRLRRHPVGVVVQDLYGAALAETGMGGGLLTRATGWLERQLLKRADGVVVIHEVFRSRLVAAGVQPDRIETIPNWSHVSVPIGVDRSAVRTRLGWGNDEIIALHAGNMGVKQGLDGLIDVAAQADASGSRVRIVLMGDGSQRDRISQLAAGVNKLSIIDPLPDGEFEEALAAADVLILHEKPGVLEMSVPSKLTSYFTAGRPVAAATHPRSGAAQLMAAASAGTVVEAGDALGLLRAVEDLGGDAAVAAANGERGRRFAADHLSATASLRQYSQWVQWLP
ncbi:glycosyltransferase family 4 protein [Klenkia soli]|uniref:glycosyltransferase family 4 protein n=1 Tax=Klenkia soli TaxID=1052260 RepID=UPI000B85E9CC|nr:glycosyltransferase family 4 protein [Klenkia soli]